MGAYGAGDETGRLRDETPPNVKQTYTKDTKHAQILVQRGFQRGRAAQVAR